MVMAMKLLKSKLEKQQSDSEDELKKNQYKNLDANSWSHQVLLCCYVDGVDPLLCAASVYNGEGPHLRSDGEFRESHSRGRHGGFHRRDAAKETVHGLHGSCLVGCTCFIKTENVN